MATAGKDDVQEEHKSRKTITAALQELLNSGVSELRAFPSQPGSLCAR